MLKFTFKRLLPALLSLTILATLPGHIEFTESAPAEITRSASAEMPAAVPENAAVYQAEEAALAGKAKFSVEHSNYTGTGFVAGYDNSGTSKTTFTVSVHDGGEYYISLRYCAGMSPGMPVTRTVGLSVNGGEAVKVTFKGTEYTWNTWDQNIQKVSLNPGTNTIAYMCLTSQDDSDLINLDKLSVWKDAANPTPYSITFWPNYYSVNESKSIQVPVYDLYTDERFSSKPITSGVTYSSSDTAVAKVNESTGVVTGVKKGTAKITASYKGRSATTTITVNLNPVITVDFANETRQADKSMFGYILTPNYDIPDSRMTLLGPIINRESIPSQNFQALQGKHKLQYDNEESVLQRSLEAYNRATSNGLKWYFILGMNPSWTITNWDRLPGQMSVGIPSNMAWYKQYMKDVLQYFKDNGAKIDFANPVNERWTGTDETYNNLWNAVREVYPDEIPIVGPSETGYKVRTDMGIPYASKSNITVEGPAWHNYFAWGWFAGLDTLTAWNNEVKVLQDKYPETNGKYRIWEENNSNTLEPVMWTRDMANVVRSGLTQNIKGCMYRENWNGMSDLLWADKTRHNPGYRAPTWWVYYMFSQLSGKIVSTSTNDEANGLSAVACKDSDESKIIFANTNTAGSISFNLRNMPFSGQDIRVDMYKITSSENNGLEYQCSITPSSGSNVNFTVDNVEANGCWMAIIKKVNTPPSFFHPMTPDDGEVVLSKPEFTWSAAKDAAIYTVKVSANKDMSNPVIAESETKGTSYTVGTELNNGQKYYWSVTAENANGSTPVTNNTVYSFVVGTSTGVPAQFGPYLPSMNAPNQAVTPLFQWSKAYDATSYRLAVSKNKDMSEPVMSVANITNLRDTPQFGPKTQGFYKPETPLEYDTTYYWMVYAANSNGERPMNGPVHYFTTKAEGDSPISFSLAEPQSGAADVSNRAVLSWQPSKNAFFYKLKVSANKDMSDPIILRDRMIYNKYTVEPNLLNSNTTYYWRVTAYTKDLNYSTKASDGAIYSFTTEAVPCSPLLYAEKAQDGGKVKLWFQPSKGATSYKIKYGTTPGNYTETLTGVTGSPYEVTGLSNGTYYFAVVASNEYGDSSIWNERSVTTSGKK